MQDSIHELINSFQTSLTQNKFKGEFHVDHATRIINATDNSIYEVLPVAVAMPYDFADLQILINLANQELFTKLHFCARGGGTGTNGQSLTDGIVIDFSRFMSRILDFNPDQQTITVEPGIILSDLNRFLAPHGLFFAPNVSTADRATIGGMIATDAAGKGSLIYGKTSDHMLGIKLILADGAIIDTLAADNYLEQSEAFIDCYSGFNGLPAAEKTNSLLHEFTSKITALLKPVQDEIAARFPPLKRPLSGYNIKECYQNKQFNLNKLIAGSEGTLGIVAAAKLKLLPIPKYKTLIVVHYDSFLAALDDAQFLIQFQPLAIEAIDEKVQKSAQTMPNWPMLAKLLNSEGKNYISNFVEFVAETSQELNAKVAKLRAALNSKDANYVVIDDKSQINQLWSIRSSAVGLIGRLPGKNKPVAFIEDAIVPPENLASLVADLQLELDQQNLNYAMYGHVDVGCIHIRPALNMQKSADRAKIRPLTQMLIQLLNKYHGILWGEHGKGYRGEFVPDVFGSILYPVLCQIKKLFDPHNRLNPGKLTTPDGSSLLRIEQIPMRGQFDEIIPSIVQQQYNDSLLCNGNGACFNQEPANIMCPSYKVTKDRIHSPKGRAMLVKEWLREKAKPDGRAELAAEEALAALNGCLGCKGCIGKCPTGVSIPDLRTKFFNAYHQEYRKRNLRESMLGRIEQLLPVAAKFPRLWNWGHKLKLIPDFGLANTPLFKSVKSLKAELQKLRVGIYARPDQIDTFKPNPVVVFADVFSGFLNREILFAACKAIQAMNMTPYVIYPQDSGKALIVSGFISEFQKNSKKLAKLFNPILERKIPLIGLENSITLMFRDEVVKYAIPFSGKILTLTEFFSLHIEQLKLKVEHKPKLVGTKQYRLLPHCTEQSLFPQEGQAWQKIFNLFDYSLEIQNAGCCGMAGVYGHLPENLANSAELFKIHWEKIVFDSEKTVLATGFSCRSQTERLLAKSIKHPIEIISQLIYSYNF